MSKRDDLITLLRTGICTADIAQSLEYPVALVERYGMRLVAEGMLRPISVLGAPAGPDESDSDRATSLLFKVGGRTAGRNVRFDRRRTVINRFRP